MFISACGSVFYTTFLCSGAVLNHWKDKLLGREKFLQSDIEQRSHGYVPRQPYDNLSTMKPSRDLEYYLQALGLDLQEYKVTTCDEFILTVHRIIDPKETEEQRACRKPVFMQHGLLSCSGTWIANGKNSLGYFFMNRAMMSGWVTIEVILKHSMHHFKEICTITKNIGIGVYKSWRAMIYQP